jgi:hypothetical protein
MLRFKIHSKPGKSDDFAVSPAGNAVTKRCAATGCSSGY